METGPCFADSALADLRATCRQESRVAAIYAFDLGRGEDCSLAALFTESLPWQERLDLELAVAKVLGLERAELLNLRRMPLVLRYSVINHGEPIYVGHPETLAVFIEETIVRYSSYYPLLEALYWTIETKPLAEDLLEM
jgi:hypothetical protein